MREESRDPEKQYIKAYKDGQYKMAFMYAKQLLGRYDEKGDNNSEGYGRALYNAAVALDQMSLYDEALRYYINAAQVKRNNSGDSLDYGNALNNIAIIYSRMGNHQRALNTHEKVLKIRGEALGKNSVEYIYSLNNLANVCGDMNKRERALELYEESLKRARSVTGFSSLDVADIYCAAANIAEYTGNFKKAIMYYEMALEIVRKERGAESFYYIRHLVLLAQAYEKADFFSFAVEYCEMAVKIRRELLKESDLDYVNNLNYLTALCHKAEQYEKAFLMHKEALRLIEKTLGEEHGICGDIKMGMALDLYRLGKYDEAEKNATTALEQRKSLLPKNSPVIGAGHIVLGTVKNGAGRSARAMDEYMQALEILFSVKGNEEGQGEALWGISAIFRRHRLYEAACLCCMEALNIRRRNALAENETDILLWERMARLRQEQEKNITAVACLKKAVRIARKIYGDKHPKYAAAMRALGKGYIAAEDYTGAVRSLEKAIEIEKNTLDEDNPQCLMTLEYLSEAYYGRGDYEKAISVFRERNDLNFEEDHQAQREAASTLLAIGCCFLRLRRAEQARSYYEEAEARLERSGLSADEKYSRRREEFISLRDKGQYKKKVHNRQTRGRERRATEALYAYLKNSVNSNESSEGEKIIRKQILPIALGEICLELDRPNEALEWFDEARGDGKGSYTVAALDCMRRAYYSLEAETEIFLNMEEEREFLINSGARKTVDYAVLLIHIGDFYFNKKEKQQALENYLKGCGYYRRLGLPDCPFIAKRLERIAKIYFDSQKNESALKYYTRLALYTKGCVGEEKTYIRLLLKIALLHIRLEKKEEAERLIDMALAFAQGHKRDIETGSILDKAGRLYYAAENADKARDTLMQVCADNGGRLTKEGDKILRMLLEDRGADRAEPSAKKAEKL